MQLNAKKKKRPPIFTNGGGRAVYLDSMEAVLRRSVMSCMLWESEFYEDGVSIADRISALIPQVRPDRVASIAVEAREKMKLRHVPLLIVREMARLPEHKALVAATLERVIQRPDELAEFVSLYWKDGKEPLSTQVKRGLAAAFLKFNEFQLAKYNRDREVTLRDVMFLCHPRAENKAQESLFKKLAAKELSTTDTWEVALSSGADKKETRERLMSEGKLGGLALLRNLRNMREVNVSQSAIQSALSEMNTDRILPFRFVTAAQHAPELEPDLEKAMFKSLSGADRLPGRTVLVVDVSGSMCGRLSAKSESTRLDTAAALAMLAREVCEDVVIYITGGNDITQVHKTKFVPARRGFALSDLIKGDNCGGGGIFLTQCMDHSAAVKSDRDIERVIVITDEQDCDRLQKASDAKVLGKNNYVVNIASARNGVGYGKWTHIDGWSEAVIDYICQFEENER